MHSFHTYIIQSVKTSKLYIGSTNNLADRLLRHNSNRNKYTKGKGPWLLIYSKSFATRAEAVQLEMALKKKKNKDRILTWIKNQSG